MLQKLIKLSLLTVSLYSAAFADQWSTPGGSGISFINPGGNGSNGTLIGLAGYAFTE
jgi:hypothetical protein